jgi:hypothetical protein
VLRNKTVFCSRFHQVCIVLTSYHQLFFRLPSDKCPQSIGFGLVSSARKLVEINSTLKRSLKTANDDRGQTLGAEELAHNQRVVILTAMARELDTHTESSDRGSSNSDTCRVGIP